MISASLKISVSYVGYCLTMEFICVLLEKKMASNLVYLGLLLLGVTSFCAAQSE